MRPDDPVLPTTAAEARRVDARTWTLTGADATIELVFAAGVPFVLDGDEELFVLPGDGGERELAGRGVCWVLPAAATSPEPAWLVRAAGPIVARAGTDSVSVLVSAREATLVRHRARPHADATGGGFALDLPGGELLADALAGFYWDTMLPSVVERTTAAGYPDASGYVVSTLAERYLGTYPDVDHEFQIKGRLAWGDRLDADVVSRMIDLQLRMMREDPQGLWRDPCAVQPDGTREYHVRRNSMDGRENAVMFLATGNIEVIESVWLYVARTKDLDWLRARIDDVEGAASLVVDCMDARGRLWSDVHYEDQVIKDGRETMSAALAARSFALLAELEDLIGRADRAVGYRAHADRLRAVLRAPLPQGYWDAAQGRFTDWVDRSGVAHDHIHLLANVLPVLVGGADDAQSASVLALVDRELDEFQRFPTFLAARIADYTESEIGDGGPYDLCAAGRYWCWDAAFWSWRRDGGMLREQLERVARQGAEGDWIMGERYDMDHVYYVDGSPWHGAAHYYEYPCVFAWVLVHEYLGVRPSLDADLLLAPRLADRGSVALEQHAYRLRYAWDGETLAIENLADFPREFALDLSALLPGADGLLASSGDRHGATPVEGGTVRVPARGRVLVSAAGAGR
jgi:hypothetical protein